MKLVKLVRPSDPDRARIHAYGCVDVLTEKDEGWTDESFLDMEPNEGDLEESDITILPCVYASAVRAYAYENIAKLTDEAHTRFDRSRPDG